MMGHPWHDVLVGSEAPKIVTAVIEIPKGSKNKYEVDKNSGLLFLDRVSSSPVMYPVNYGFVPQTYCDDGDALDIMVIGQETVPPLCLMHAKVLGAMRMIDNGEADDKIVAVHAHDPQYKHVNTLSDLSPHLLKEIEQFFKIYKLLDNKKVEVSGFVQADAAHAIIVESIKFYEKEKEKLKSHKG